jgi:hypothetical protein
MAMETGKKSIKKLWFKLLGFFEREMVFTLWFWLVAFLVALIMKLLRLDKH